MFLKISEAPTLSYIDNDQRAMVGSTIELRCIATGIPPPAVTWVIEDDNGDIPESGITDSSAAITSVMVTEDEKR